MLPLVGCLRVWPVSDPSSVGIRSGMLNSISSSMGTRPVPSTLVPLEQALLVGGVSGPEPSRSDFTGG